MKKIWSSFFGGVSISHHISEDLEIGFSGYGPSLGMRGVFSVKDKHEFVHKITLHIETNDKSDQHELEWFAFREHDFMTGDFSGMHAKSPSKFMVVPLNPYNYNIVFVDNTCYAEMKPYLQELKMYWHLGPKYNPQLNALPEDFLKRSDVLECLKNIEPLCYWHAGHYQITMTVIAGANSQELLFKRSFEIEEQHPIVLKNNILKIADDVCCRIPMKYTTIKTILRAE